MQRSSSLLVVALLFAVNVHGATDPAAAARAHIENSRAAFGLTASDTTEMTLSDSYRSKHNGVAHVYYVQRLRGIRVFNGIANVNVAPDGRAVGMGNRFAPNLAGTANTTVPLLTAADAVRRASDNLGLLASTLNTVSSLAGPEQATVFSGNGFSRSDVPARLTFYRVSANSVRLAWDVVIEPDSEHIWEILVDAVNGSILFRHNHVLYDSYKVFSWPTESPNHVRTGQPLPPADGREVVTDTAADAIASRHGWHDLNGVAGADTVDTSGNNVNAQTDLDNDNAWLPTAETRPLSTTRDFQPALDLAQFATSYREAAVVNLFYWNNVNHDIHYRYGFDEAAGNFQLNNYTLEGLPGDAVEADAQDGSGTNNANFATPPDGRAPRMQMYVWGPSISNQVAVNSHSGLGPYAASAAIWGPPLTESGITGDVVLANDGIGTTSDACEAITNSVAGKIVLTERGTCNFVVKVQNAQAAGAIAVIVANNQPGEPITMGGTEDPANPITISSVMIKQDAGNELRASLPANVTLSNVAASIPTRDSDFDNGVIIHEYGHGVSNRLTGGPAQNTCLTIQQQGGEGWSDFWAMAFTQRAGATGAEPRGMGTYVNYEDDPATGKGIRPYPYSTNMSVNPMTYGLLSKGTLVVPHGVGSVWATTLWDMYWTIVNGVPSLGLPGYGFRENLYDFTSPLAGNQIAIQLVTDGLKFQPCNPTFLNARDAILQADAVNYGGKFKWHIWYAFARRGMGVDARDDGGMLNVTENFAMPPDAPGACTAAPSFAGVMSVVSATDGTCQLNVEWTRALTDPCNSGRVTYSVYRSTSNNFTPGPATLVASGIETLSYADNGVTGGTRYYYIVRAVDGFGTSDSNRKIVSEVAAGTLSNGGSFSDNGGDGNTAIHFTPAGGWALRSSGGAGHTALTPSKVWVTSASGNYADDTCATLTSDTIYLGPNPVLRFASKHDIEPTWDAGVIEIATAGNGFTHWQKLDMLYPGIILGADGSVLSCGTTALAKGEPAFTGTTVGQYLNFEASLARYANETVRIRFTFGADGSTNDLGWFVDNITISDVMKTGACNAPPKANDDTASAAENRSTVVPVLANDTDANGEALRIVRVSPASNGMTRVNSDNTVTYTPRANYNGNDSFTYTIRDNAGATDTATVLVTVTPVNDAPLAAADNGTVFKNSGTDFGVLDNDVDPDGDKLRVASVSRPSHGTVSINPDSTVRYTPKKGFKGTDTFSYIVTDNNGGTSTATVTVSVTRE